MKKVRSSSLQGRILRELRAGEKESLEDSKQGQNLCTLTTPCPLWVLKISNFSFTEDLSITACHKAPGYATQKQSTNPTGPTQRGQSTNLIIQQMDGSFPSQGIPVLCSSDFPWWSKAPEKIHLCYEPWCWDVTLSSSNTNLCSLHQITRLCQEHLAYKMDCHFKILQDRARFGH